MTETIPKIVRLVNVRDTRDRIEVGDRFVPVPGSGDLRACDRCGREHEIHVDVELADGRRANIGSGCAKGETMEIQSRLKSAVSAAKTRSKLRAELVTAKQELATASAVDAEVRKLSLPEPRLIEEIPDPRGVRQVWAMDDAHVWVLPGSKFDTERRQSLVSSWRNDRALERLRAHGLSHAYLHIYKKHVDDLEDRLAKVERKLAGMMF
jgi:hypothetical protein